MCNLFCFLIIYVYVLFFCIITVGQENKKTNNDTSENVASKPMPMSFLPAGMLTSAKPMERLRNYTQKEEKLRRPVAESIKQCDRSQPAQYIHIYKFAK
jgi:hypothetical protein